MEEAARRRLRSRKRSDCARPFPPCAPFAGRPALHSVVGQTKKNAGGKPKKALPCSRCIRSRRTRPVLARRRCRHTAASAAAVLLHSKARSSYFSVRPWFPKAPRTGRQPAGGTGIRQKARKWLSAGLCYGSMRRPTAKQRKKPLFGKAGHTVNRNASLIKGLAQPLANRDSIAPKRRRKQRRPRATAGELASRRQEELPTRQLRKVCRPTTWEARCPTAENVRLPPVRKACRPTAGNLPSGGTVTLPPATASAVPPP